MPADFCWPCTQRCAQVGCLLKSPAASVNSWGTTWFDTSSRYRQLRRGNTTSTWLDKAGIRQRERPCTPEPNPGVGGPMHDLDRNPGDLEQRRVGPARRIGRCGMQAQIVVGGVRGAPAAQIAAAGRGARPRTGRRPRRAGQGAEEPLDQGKVRGARVAVRGAELDKDGGLLQVVERHAEGAELDGHAGRLVVFDQERLHLLVVEVRPPRERRLKDRRRGLAARERGQRAVRLRLFIAPHSS